MELLKDESPLVKKAARKALAKIVGKDVGGSAYAWQRYLEEQNVDPRDG